MLIDVVARHLQRRNATRQRGLSIVELLVGVAIGLFLVGGVVTLFVTNLGNSRRMLVEARVNQDLRVAADLVSRDLRRAGYWQNAIEGTRVLGATLTPLRNPYGAVTPSAGTSTITYTFSRDSIENNAIDTNERFGFRLDGGVIQMRTAAATWQSVTDPTVMTVDQFTITAVETAIDMGNACAKVCPPPMSATYTCPNPPVLGIRNYGLVLRAVATADAAVVRRIDTRVRVRNDLLTGVCPA